MYADMAEMYSGFGFSVDINVRFDTLRFVDAESQAGTHFDDWKLDLLHTGSAVAILARLYVGFLEEQGVGGWMNEPIRAAVDQGCLRLVPDIEAVAREALRRDPMTLEDPWFDEAVQVVYRQHVLGYLRHLSTQDSQERRLMRQP